MSNSTSSDDSDVKSTTTSSILSSIIFNSALFGVFLLAFLILKLRFKRIYSPKSLDLIVKTNKDQKFMEPLPPGILMWLPSILTKPKSFIIQSAGLDGYFFLRYLMVIACISMAAIVLAFPVLFPINVTGDNGQTGLDRLSFSNVKNHHKFYAHALISLIFYPFVLFVIFRELIHYTNLRQTVLSSPKYAYKLSSRVILVQNVPKQYRDPSELKKLFSGVNRVWLAETNAELTKKVEERDKLINDLENTLNGLLVKATKVRAKAIKKGEILEPVDELSAYIPQKKRPVVKKYKLFGAKEDKLAMLKRKIGELNDEIDAIKNGDKDAKKNTMNSAFIEFKNQHLAQIALQIVAHHRPFTMSEHFIGVEPSNIVWMNMRLFWYEKLVRKSLAVAAIVVVCIFWAIPVAFVGTLSNLTYLTNKLHFLRFIYHLPDSLLGLITSILPTVLLSVLMSLLPIFIRLMGRVAGLPTSQHVEYFTQQAYFAFQVIQVFLVTTISSSAASVVTQIIQQPTSAMKLLSANLPKASNFYVSYIVLQCFSIAGATLLQLSSLIVFYVLGFVLDKTARKKWNRYSTLGTNNWGTDFPPYTNLAVIMLAYAVISPIVLLFTAFGFGLLYIAYLYFLCYINNNAAKDSRGLHYPRALFQTIVGIYLGQVCLLGLFAVAKAWGPLVINAVALGITVFVHVNLSKAFDHLMGVVPLDMMRALDGESETASDFAAVDISTAKTDTKRYSEATDAKDSIDTDHLNTSNAHVGTSIAGQNQNSSYSFSEAMEHYDVLAQEPLLAEGDNVTLPKGSTGVLKKFFLPATYLSYHFTKTLLPQSFTHADPEDWDTENIEKAYLDPALTKKAPIVWIPKDEMGLSAKFIEQYKGIVEISDEYAEITSKNKIVFLGPPPDYPNRKYFVEEVEMKEF